MDFGATTLNGSSKVKSDESSARPSGDLTSNWFDHFYTSSTEPVNVVGGNE